MTEEEKLKVAIEALERIVASDPGPAYYIAKAALDEIKDTPERKHDNGQRKRTAGDAD